MKPQLAVVICLLVVLSLVSVGCDNSAPNGNSPPDSDDVELEVHFINVGQGESVLVDLGETEVLIDGGGNSSDLVQYLHYYVDGVIEVMVATHPDADHVGGLAAVLDAFEIEDIWLNGEAFTAFPEFTEGADAEGASVHQAERGLEIVAGDLIFSVLHPVKPLLDDSNNNSVVLRLSYGHVTFLFMGGAEKEAEASILEAGLTVQAKVLKVGNHGSRTATSAEFLAAVSPRIAVYMAGEDNSQGYPHTETIEALTELGASIYGTDTNNNIIVSTAGNSYSVRHGEKAMPPAPVVPTTPAEDMNVDIAKVFFQGLVPEVESDEYVEIVNHGKEPRDLTGWVLKDIADGYPSFTFPAYVLQPRERIRVYTNEIHPEYGGFSFGHNEAIWDDSVPDTAALFDAEGREVYRRSY